MLVMRTMASVSVSSRGSGTSCTRTSRGPCQVSALIFGTPHDSVPAEAGSKRGLPRPLLALRGSGPALGTG
ncbi:hypothetical protein GCM10009533_47940 [Saccharopolyspora spinosporotrichia]|uniref:Uncharacterized protein n=1 Tax=Saccharopolyspora erythraea TaxID=1836 RepID=A0ABP3NG51_SACER